MYWISNLVCSVEGLSFDKISLERKVKAKKLKFNLGCGLARSSFQFLENVIKGKEDDVHST